MTTEENFEIEPLRDLLQKTVHATFSHPARVNLSRNFEGYGSVRIDAVDAKLVKLTPGFATFEVECVYPSRGDVQTETGEVGLQGYVHRCTIVQPIKYLGPVVATPE